MAALTPRELQLDRAVRQVIGPIRNALRRKGIRRPLVVQACSDVAAAAIAAEGDRYRSRMEEIGRLLDQLEVLVRVPKEGEPATDEVEAFIQAWDRLPAGRLGAVH